MPTLLTLSNMTKLKVFLNYLHLKISAQKATSNRLSNSKGSTKVTGNNFSATRKTKQQLLLLTAHNHSDDCFFNIPLSIFLYFLLKILEKWDVALFVQLRSPSQISLSKSAGQFNQKSVILNRYSRPFLSSIK